MEAGEGKGLGQMKGQGMEGKGQTGRDLGQEKGKAAMGARERSQGSW